MCTRLPARRAFTLIELLVVVAIIAILATIAVFNMKEATERSLRAANAANLHAIATALQAYVVDFNKLPPADGTAGPFSSIDRTDFGNGPSSGGSWSGVPWMLYERKYLSTWEALFCPRYLREYRGGATVRGNHPRFHNFRYAYNAAARDAGYTTGGQGDAMSGTVWLVRDLYLPPYSGAYYVDYPNYPADYNYPWGELRDLEHVMFADMSVRLVKGGTNTPPDAG